MRNVKNKTSIVSVGKATNVNMSEKPNQDEKPQCLMSVSVWSQTCLFDVPDQLNARFD